MFPQGLLEVQHLTGTCHYALNGEPVILGRAPECAIRLEDSLVSRQHARLERGRMGSWTVTDLSSSNGTCVNGNLIPAQTPLPIGVEDIIQIGEFQIQWESPPAQEINDAPAIWPYPAGLIHAAPARVILQVKTPARSQEVLLGGQPVSIGRDPENDLVIDEKVVSRHHARLDPSHFGYTLVDLNSGNGLTYRGERIPGKLLVEGDEFQIGEGVFLTYRIIIDSASPAASSPEQFTSASTPYSSSPPASAQTLASPPASASPRPAPLPTPLSAGARSTAAPQAAPAGDEPPVLKIDLLQRLQLTIGRSPENDLPLTHSNGQLQDLRSQSAGPAATPKAGKAGGAARTKRPSGLRQFLVLCARYLDIIRSDKW